MKKKLFLLLATALCAACHSQPQPVLPPGLEGLKIIPLQPSQSESIPETVIQVSKNPAHTGKVSVVIRNQPSGFRTQKAHTDVQFIKLYLVPGNIGLQTPVFSSTLIPKTGPTQMFTFSGSNSGSFYVAASAYDSNPSNITNTSGLNHIQVSDLGLKHAFVSATGGEDPLFAGRVTVIPVTHMLLGTPTLGIDLTLMPG